MEKTVHIIWHHKEHHSISDASEVVGVVLTGWQDAELVVEQLNILDPNKPMFGRNYWKTEVNVLIPGTR